MAKEAYISGVGQSEVGVRLTRSPMGLTKDAIMEALADAGLTLDQIDGVASYPGKSHGYLGFSPVGVDEVIEQFGIKARWHFGGGEIPAQLSAIAMAADAVRNGHARHIICFRTVYEAAAMARPDEFPPLRRAEVDGFSQWTAPFFAISAACWVAQYAMRQMKRHGMTREQLAQVALNATRNASLNPRAGAITKEPLTMDKYMSARLISTPFCLYDCDRFTDCSTVVIVSAGDALDEVSANPVRIVASAGSWPAIPPARSCGARPTTSPRTSTPSSSMTGSPSSRSAGWRRWASARSARGTGSSRAARASPSAANCRSTPAAARSARGGCTASASPTRRRPSCAARPARGRFRAIRKWRWRPRAAGHWPRRCCWQGIEGETLSP